MKLILIVYFICGPLYSKYFNNKWCWENWTGTCKKMSQKVVPPLRIKGHTFLILETRPPTDSILENKLKMDKRLEVVTP